MSYAKNWIVLPSGLALNLHHIVGVDFVTAESFAAVYYRDDETAANHTIYGDDVAAMRDAIQRRAINGNPTND